MFHSATNINVVISDAVGAACSNEYAGSIKQPVKNFVIKLLLSLQKASRPFKAHHDLNPPASTLSELLHCNINVHRMDTMSDDQ